jgi:hypothetical protein
MSKDETTKPPILFGRVNKHVYPTSLYSDPPERLTSLVQFITHVWKV